MNSIDRIAPTRRPEGRVVMKQSWQYLTFLHWEFPAEQLARLIPKGLTLDTFEGRAFVGLVPFTMRNVHPVGLPSVPALSNFHETNVRTYVHYQGRDPGVWFFSLEAANPIAVMLARWWFSLNYQYARMSLEYDEADGFPTIRYESKRRWPGSRNAICRVETQVTGPVAPAVPGSLEHFLAERYVLYTTRRGRIFSGRVHHDPYPLREAKSLNAVETLLSCADLLRLDLPPLAHYASGVDVDVFGLKAEN